MQFDDILLTMANHIASLLTKNLHKGFLVLSSVLFVSLSLLLQKSDRSLQFCIDYQKLNAITYKDCYLLLLLEETLSCLSRAKVFTKLDVRQAFHKIQIHPDSEELTTFQTYYKTYKNYVIPFSLINRLATYQRYINNVLFEYLDDFCTAYLDNIIIYLEDLLEHTKHVCKVLLQLVEARLQVDIKKCKFYVTCTKFLGYIIRTKEIEAVLERVLVIC